jgi:glycosyltransferase involved in cell wall biosynthesis
MRILIVNEALRGGGGVETYLSTLLPGLQAAGHEIGVLHDNPAADGGPQRIAPDDVWHAGIQDHGMDASLARIRQFAPDVCFSHNMRRLAYTARLLAEWPVVKMMHGHFGTCVSRQKAFAFPGVSACTREFGLGCLAYYLPRRCGQANPFVMLQEYQWGAELRSLFPRYRGVVVASRFMRDEYLRAGLAADRVHAIPLFAAGTVAAPLADDDVRATDVVFLGRMTALKGPDILIDAIAHASKRLGRAVSVVLAGEGPERKRLPGHAASIGVNARFPGWLTPAERDRLLRESALIAVPSRWPEPFGLVGLEAGVFGTPAVAFDAGGIADWLTDRENGRLIGPTLGAVGLGDAIADILANVELRRRFAAGARAVSAKFNLEAHLRALIPVLTRAAEAGPSPA